MSTFALLIVALNEETAMRVILPRIDHSWVDEILLVDGGSTDNTISVAEEHGIKVYRQNRAGLRHAYIESLKLLTSEFIIPFSPDGNSIPELLPKLIEKTEEGYDMVICSRYFGDAKSEDDDLITRFGNWLFTFSINIFHRAKYTDAMVMYRSIRKSKLFELQLDKDEAFRIPETLFRTNLCIMPLLSIRAARQKMVVSQIPGDEPKRIGGERKLRIIRWGLAYYFQVIREWMFDFSKNNN